MRKALFITLLALFATEVKATILGVGAVTMPEPALSLYYSAKDMSAFHFATAYTEDRVWFTGDYQRSLTAFVGSSAEWLLNIYSGLGLKGEGDKKDTVQEKFFLRLPIGVQTHLSGIQVQVFAEGVGMLGSLPNTRMSAEFSSGVRAYF
jgi:hypothetical protein